LPGGTKSPGWGEQEFGFGIDTLAPIGRRAGSNTIEHGIMCCRLDRAVVAELASLSARAARARGRTQRRSVTRYIFCNVNCLTHSDQFIKYPGIGRAACEVKVRREDQ